MCWNTYEIIEAEEDAQSIADKFEIDKERFEANNYCYYDSDKGGMICPPFYPGMVSF